MPENDFLWPVFSPYFLILVSVFEWADKSCLWPIFALVTCDQYRTCKHDMLYAFKPCALEINSNGGFKRDHVEPCYQRHSISTTTLPMSTKLGRMVTYLEEFFLIELIDHLVTWCCEFRQHNEIITSPLSITTKLGRVVVFYEGLPPVKSHDPLIKWATSSHEVIWKTYISNFTRIMATKVADFREELQHGNAKVVTDFLLLVKLLGWHNLLVFLLKITACLVISRLKFIFHRCAHLN